jgi:chromosome segregation ATPase
MQLFGKRELLKGRAQKLENAVIQLGALIEEEAPKGSASQYPERDISPTTLDFIDDQEFSTFWPGYSNSYEVADASTMNIKRRESELFAYYKRSPEGKVLKDGRGLKITSGEGTMQGLLDDVLGKAEAQYNLLNDTRQQMAETRAELVAANQDLNQAKSGYRQTLATLKETEEEKARVEGELQVAKNEIAEAKETVRALEDAIAEERRQLQFVEEQKIELEDTVTQLKEEIATLRGQTPTRPTDQAEQQGLVGQIVVDPGTKGTVVAVDDTWNFVILALNDATLVELLGENLDQAPGAVEYMIKRDIAGEETFVTKVKLQQVRRDKKLAIASIMSDWQQMGVQEGDVVFR